MAIQIPQTSYSAAPAVAVPGFMADSDPSRSVVTGYVETAGGLEAGRFVKRGTRYRQVLALAAAADVTNLLRGVTVWENIRQPSTPQFLAKEPVGVMRKGRIWVLTAGTDTADSGPCFIIHSGADAGKVAGAAGGGPDATVVPNGAARIIKGAAVGQLSLVEVNLP